MNPVVVQGYSFRAAADAVKFVGFQIAAALTLVDQPGRTLVDKTRSQRGASLERKC